MSQSLSELYEVILFLSFAYRFSLFVVISKQSQNAICYVGVNVSVLMLLLSLGEEDKTTPRYVFRGNKVIFNKMQI